MKWGNGKIFRFGVVGFHIGELTMSSITLLFVVLTEAERQSVFRQLLRCQERGLELTIVCVLPEKSELMFKVNSPKDLSDIVEKAKTKAGKEIVKKSGERFPPFYAESYDHIVRDDKEFEEYWEQILSAPADMELVDDPGDYPFLYVPYQPESV